MKILYLAAADSIHSHKWINYFSELGYDITWISLVPSSIKVQNNIEFYEMKGNILSSLRNVRKLVLTINPDVVHVHYLGYYALLGIFSGSNCIVSTAWGSDVIEGKKSFLKKQILSRILKKSNIVTCDAYHMRNEILKFNVSADKIHIINFGIDTLRFSKQKKDLKLLQSFGVSDEVSIISLRNFEIVYDVRTLLYAAEILLNKNYNVRFILIGRGELDSELKKLAHKLKIENSICFAGFVDNKLLPEILSSADIYVSTSLSDAGIAASTAEAMACETPVVVTNSGENDRWIVNGESGYLVPVSQSISLSECLIDLIENKERRQHVGQAGRKIMVKNNDGLIEMEKMHSLYLGLIRDPSLGTNS